MRDNETERGLPAMVDMYWNPDSEKGKELGRSLIGSLPTICEALDLMASVLRNSDPERSDAIRKYSMKLNRLYNESVTSGDVK